MAYLPQNYYQPNLSNYPQNNYYGGNLLNYQPNVPSTINGKIVENSDMVKVSEIPIGGYGVFPKADMTEIYVKIFNNDGSTKIVTYIPFVEQEKEESKSIDYSSTLDRIQKSINDLNKKLDEYKPSVPSRKMKKEVTGDE